MDKTSKVEYTGYGFPVKPNVLQEHLQGLYEKNDKRIDPEIVLKDAKKKGSPIHDCFEWDDKIAAHSHRLVTARKIIASVTVVTKKGNKSVIVRSFVNVKTDKNGNFTTNPFGHTDSYYVSIADALEDDEIKMYTFEMAMQELGNFKRKYKDLMEFAKLFDFIDKNYKKAA